ncbi:MAG TPA: cytochrome c biogenesis CcdA family protein [Methanoregulaceae archaeon]|nr:cytochrome c biogenesis CcdA family protein [Methanoregulaceae archaeon]
MKIIRNTVLILIILFCFCIPLLADSPAPPSSNGNPDEIDSYHIVKFIDEKPVIHFFYNQNCAECIKTLPYLQDFENTHDDFIVRYYDIRENSTNRQLLTLFSYEYRVDFSPVPVAFAGDSVLTGYDEIIRGLEEMENITAVTATKPTIQPEETPQVQGHSELTIPLIISAALIDGINPCAFSVLIFLLLTIMALDTRKKMVLVGSIFILAVFVFYFLSGLGLFTLIQSAGISRGISLVAAVVALIAGTVSIIDGVRGKQSQSLSIPESKKGIIEKYVKRASLPGAFVLGILVGMFELPCTGGIYLAILSLLSNRMNMVEGIPYLLLYNIFFVLPMVVILAVVAWGIPVERLDRVRIEKRSLIRILMGVVMIFLGILLLLEFI